MSQILRVIHLFDNYVNDRITQQAFFDYLREEKRQYKFLKEKEP